MRLNALILDWIDKPIAAELFLQKSLLCCLSHQKPLWSDGKCQYLRIHRFPFSFPESRYPVFTMNNQAVSLRIFHTRQNTVFFQYEASPLAQVWWLSQHSPHLTHSFHLIENIQKFHG